MLLRLGALLCVGLLLPVTSCAPQNEYQPPPPPDVTVVQPLQQTVTEYMEETGGTEAVELAAVRARVRGFLVSINFEQGDDVKEGDVLYHIEDQEYQAQVNQLAAAVKVTEAESENAEAQYRRAVPLAEKGVMTQEELQERKAARDVAKSQIASAQAALEASQIDLNYTQVRSPITGRAGKTLVKVGNLVGDKDATQLTTVVNYDPIYANFSISEQSLLGIMQKYPKGEDGKINEKKIPVSLRRAVDDGYPFHGHIDYADLAVDQSTGTYMVRAIFPNPELKILPGLFVRVRVPIGEYQDAFLVPRAAVSFDQEGRYLLAVNSQNKVERRNVELGPEMGQMQVVLSGLAADDWIITGGIQRAREGAEVTPTRSTMPAFEEEAVQGDPVEVEDAPDGAPSDEKAAPASEEEEAKSG